MTGRKRVLYKPMVNLALAGGGIVESAQIGAELTREDQDHALRSEEKDTNVQSQGFLYFPSALDMHNLLSGVRRI